MLYLKDSLILSDEMMDGFESGGSCKETCKKQCVTNIGAIPPEKMKIF